MCDRAPELWWPREQKTFWRLIRAARVIVSQNSNEAASHLLMNSLFWVTWRLKSGYPAGIANFHCAARVNVQSPDSCWWALRLEIHFRRPDESFFSWTSTCWWKCWLFYSNDYWKWQIIRCTVLYLVRCVQLNQSMKKVPNVRTRQDDE